MSTMTEKAKAYTLSLLHPKTIAKSIAAEGRGIAIVVVRIFDFMNARDKKELLSTNATLHEQVTGRRRIWVSIEFFFWLLLLGFAYLHRPYGIALFIWLHMALFFIIGRNSPVLTRVQTSRMAGEALIRKIFDELTLPASVIKKGEVSTAIIDPPARTAVNTGYEVTVRIPDSGDPSKAFAVNKDNRRLLAHKLQKDSSCVIPYPVKGDDSLIRLLVLDKDPWSLPPTSNPLVDKPRQVNLWREKINLGIRADGSIYSRFLVQQGDGGGHLTGGAPRKGKTNWFMNLLIAVILDPRANARMIDGKAVDFEVIRKVCKSFIGDADFSDIELLTLSTNLLQELKKEINRRRKMMLHEEDGNVNEETCRKYGFSLEFLFIDELAVLTSDMMSEHSKEVAAFLNLLSWIVRLGPAFGVFCILATQRPSKTSVPDEIRSMIVWRTAFYIGSVSGSLAIMGKAGPANRADWLPGASEDDPKGVAIAIGEGQIRPHLVGKRNLARIVDYAYALRASYDPHDNAPPAAVHPEPVRTILTFFAEGQTEIETYKLLELLATEGFAVNEVNLAKSLKPFGISPVRFYVDKKQLRGYRKSDLMNTPKVVSQDIFHPSDAVSETDQDGEEDGTQDRLAGLEGTDDD